MLSLTKWYLIRRWVIPLLILIIALMAWPLRWSKEATQNYNNGENRITCVFKKDRWIGVTWCQIYSFGEDGVSDLSVPAIIDTDDSMKVRNQKINREIHKRNAGTVIWGIIVIGSLIALYRWYRKVEISHEIHLYLDIEQEGQ